ncbi:D-glycero-alpha-D-manno-heptose-1,7-bisphosphate 7-phosphatase [bioreactor metagenome]|uniref:D-glycero-alpha-D-manno-heptose-1,7-bisphosphate 7-phosphatase n=1 Tax=bioreactor metagenome TaxID=1076179 RepID=A0A645HN15_9ZZZZ
MNRFHMHLNLVLKEKYGAHIDAFYFCPHHPDITGSCSCRKPAPGMILSAQKEFNIDLSQSVFYGDKESDRQAAMAAGVSKFILVKDNEIIG